MLFRDLLILHNFKSWPQKLTELEKEVLLGHQKEPVENIRESDLPTPMTQLVNQNLQRRTRMHLSDQEFTLKTGFKFEMTRIKSEKDKKKMKVFTEIRKHTNQKYYILA